MTYPCPNCGTPSRVITPKLIKSNGNGYIIKRNRRCPNPDCDTRFVTGEALVGVPILRYSKSKLEAREARNKEIVKSRSITANNKGRPPHIRGGSPSCPYCPMYSTGLIKMTEARPEIDEYWRRHVCLSCAKSFWSMTRYSGSNDTIVYRKKPGRHPIL